MKKWLIERFLPMWAKETVLTECQHLRNENEALRGQIKELRAYIRGIRIGLRRHRQEEKYEHTSV